MDEGFLREFRRIQGEESALWKPDWVEQLDPTDGEEPGEEGEEGDEGEPAPINGEFEEIEVASPEVLLDAIHEFGVHLEPEIARHEEEKLGRYRQEGGVGGGSYASMYPTRFFFAPRVKRSINRQQKKFPWLTYCNTYEQHPPVYGHKYEQVSVDYWGGGKRDGKYVGYRGKDIRSVPGLDHEKLFNSIFNDPKAPNINWIIHSGRMWVRGTGWGPSPGGPPDSDPLHMAHIHVTYL